MVKRINGVEVLEEWICSWDWTRSGVEGFIKLSDYCMDKRKKGEMNNSENFDLIDVNEEQTIGDMR